MKKFLAALLTVSSLFVMPISHAEIVTYTGVDDYTVGERETPEEAKTHSKKRALRNAQEQAGFYVSSYSNSKNFKLFNDEIIVISKGFMKMVGNPKQILRTIDEGRGSSIHTEVTVQINTDDVDKFLDKIINDQMPDTPPQPVQPSPPDEVQKPAPQKPAQSNVQIFEGKGQYIMDDFDNVGIAKQRAQQRAERDAQKKAGVYLTSYLRVVNVKLTDDEISAVTNNIIKVLSVSIDRKPYEVNGEPLMMIEATVTVSIDTQGIYEYLKRDDKDKATIVQRNNSLKNAKARNDALIEDLKEQYKRS